MFALRARSARPPARVLRSARPWAAARSSSSAVRTYRYVVDHTGAVHLDEPARARTLATAYRDPKFLDNLYRGLRRRRDGRWTQRCAGEINVLRADTGDERADASVIVVFGGFDADAEELLWGGTMRQRFAPDWLRVSRSGEFFHALENGRYGDYGLVGSAVAHSLSQRLSDGEDGDLELLWDGERHVVRRVTFGGDDADKFLYSE